MKILKTASQYNPSKEPMKQELLEKSLYLLMNSELIYC